MKKTGEMRRGLAWVRWVIAISAAGAGAALGLGGYTFYYAKGASYLTSDPRACANCHVMQGHFDAWLKSSHRSVAACNDCHAPAGLIPKYWTKAENGFWHSLAFTTGRYPDNIRAHARNVRVAETSCRKCHAEITSTIDGHGSGRASCIKCHRTVGHME